MSLHDKQTADKDGMSLQLMLLKKKEKTLRGVAFTMVCFSNIKCIHVTYIINLIVSGDHKLLFSF